MDIILITEVTMNKVTMFAMLSILSINLGIQGMDPNRFPGKNKPNSAHTEQYQNDDDDLVRLAMQLSLESYNQSKTPQTTNQTTDEYSKSLEAARKLQEQFDAQLAQELQQSTEHSIPQPINKIPHHSTPSPAKNIPNNTVLRGTRIPARIPQTTTTTSTKQKPAPQTQSNNSSLEVFKLNAIHQKGATCGIHAACNALAIYTQIVTGSELNHTALQSSCNSYLKEWESAFKLDRFKNFARENVDNFELCHILHYLQQKAEYRALLKDAKFFFFGVHQGNPIEFLSGIFPGTGLHDTIIQKHFTDFKHAENSVINFIYNTGGHWVTVCAVKQNNKVKLYFVDSANGTTTQAQSFIEYLKKFLA